MILENVNRILIVRLSSLGDILLTTPLIRSIKNKFPKIKIDFILRAEYEDLLKFNPYTEELLLFNSDKNIIEELKRKISFSNYDLIIDLQNNIRSRNLLKRINTSKVFFKKRNIEKFLLVHFKINKLRKAPQIPERYAQLVNDKILDEKGLDLFTNCESNSKLKEHDNLVGFCPGSKHFTKMWPTQNFISFGKLLEDKGYTVVLFGGKEDQEVCKEISSNLNSPINLSNENDILQTAADMKECKVIYCNDSGLMHTASAVNIPVIAFFGSTVKEFGFSPYKSSNLILENNYLSCRPCTHIGRKNCPKKHFNCMNQIVPQEAFNSLKLLLSK